MGLGTIIFLLIVFFIIYAYFYLKKKFGSLKNALNSLNPINLIGNQVTSGVSDIGKSIGL